MTTDEPCPYGVAGHVWQVMVDDECEGVVLRVEPVEPCHGDCSDQVADVGIITAEALVRFQLQWTEHGECPFEPDGAQCRHENCWELVPVGDTRVVES
jgi:hypothetical protein